MCAMRIPYLKHQVAERHKTHTHTERVLLHCELGFLEHEGLRIREGSERVLWASFAFCETLVCVE